jgi:hypothetical protein
VALLQGLEDVVAGPLDGEIDQRGSAAEQGRTGDLLRWGGLHAREAHNGCGDMGVGLNAPRNDDLAAGIDDAPDVARQRAWSRDGDDLLSLNGYIPITNSPGGHHLTTSNHIINHRLSLPIKLRSTRNCPPLAGMCIRLSTTRLILSLWEKGRVMAAGHNRIGWGSPHPSPLPVGEGGKGTLVG